MHNFYRTIHKLIILFFILSLMTFLLGPLLWMADIAVRNPSSVEKEPGRLFQDITGIDNFIHVLREENTLVYFKNSFIISVFTILISLAISIPAAYSLTVFRFPLKNLFLAIITVPQFIPSIINIIPVYLIFQKAGLGNTRLAMILFHSSRVSLIIWLFVSYFESIQKNFFEDALINGASHLKIIIKIIMPLSFPALAAASIQIFNGSWNAFFSALIFLLDEDIKTVPLGLYQFIDRYNVNYSSISAFNILSVIPTIVLFYLLKLKLKNKLENGEGFL